MDQGITGLDWISIALYSIALLAIALYHSRKVKKQDDIFLAGRSMRRWPIAISMYMALFSTNTFLGSTGWVNRPNGTIWICLQTFGIVAAVPLIVWLYPTLFFRLRITSAYEYLDMRFNHSVRTRRHGVLLRFASDVDVHHSVLRLPGPFGHARLDRRATVCRTARSGPSP